MMPICPCSLSPAPSSYPSFPLSSHFPLSSYLAKFGCAGCQRCRPAAGALPVAFDESERGVLLVFFSFIAGDIGDIGQRRRGSGSRPLARRPGLSLRTSSGDHSSGRLGREAETASECHRIAVVQKRTPRSLCFSRKKVELDDEVEKLSTWWRIFVTICRVDVEHQHARSRPPVALDPAHYNATSCSWLSGVPGESGERDRKDWKKRASLTPIQMANGDVLTTSFPSSTTPSLKKKKKVPAAVGFDAIGTPFTRSMRSRRRKEHLRALEVEQAFILELARRERLRRRRCRPREGRLGLSLLRARFLLRRRRRRSPSHSTRGNAHHVSFKPLW